MQQLVRRCDRFGLGSRVCGHARPRGNDMSRTVPLIALIACLVTALGPERQAQAAGDIL